MRLRGKQWGGGYVTWDGYKEGHNEVKGKAMGGYVTWDGYKGEGRRGTMKLRGRQCYIGWL